MSITGSNDRGKRGKGRARVVAKSKAKPARKATSGKTLRFTIPSDFLAGRDVQEQILNQVAENGFTSQNTFAVKLSVEEALINAIKHGNKLDPKKEVKIQANITPKKVEIIIEDEGPGFDRSCVPDPTLEENLQKCSGRGILLIEAYMNSVEWTKGGRRVRMIKTNEE